MLAVEGALTAETAGFRLQIDGRGGVVTCRLDGGTGGFIDMLRRGRQIVPALRALSPLLLRSGLRIEIVAGERRIGRLGSGVKQNALGRLLGIPSAHLGS